MQDTKEILTGVHDYTRFDRVRILVQDWDKIIVFESFSDLAIRKLCLGNNLVINLRLSKTQGKNSVVLRQIQAREVRT